MLSPVVGQPVKDLRLGAFAQTWAWAWLLLFLATVFLRSSGRPPNLESGMVLFISGVLYGCVFEKENLRKLLLAYRRLWMLVGGLAVGLCLSEIVAGFVSGFPVPLSKIFQASLLLTVLPLTLILSDRRRLRFLFVVFAALSLWHYVAMPIETFYGRKVTWHEEYILGGSLGNQAAGLAYSRVYFAGFYMPLFFLTLGPLAAKRIFPRLWLPDYFALTLAVLWLFPVACAGSRTGLVAALAAVIVLALPMLRRRILPILVLLAVVVAAGFIWRASYPRHFYGFENHLFGDWPRAIASRLEMLALFTKASLHWPWVFIGHGMNFDRSSSGLVLSPTLGHSHNDIVEMLFRWGAVNLALYLACWWQLLKLGVGYLRQKEYWPLAVLVAFVPNIMTDLGLIHFEKACFFILMIALAIAMQSSASAKFVSRINSLNE